MRVIHETTYPREGLPETAPESIPEAPEVETRVVPVEAAEPPARPITSGISPFDLDPLEFQAALDRRKANRAALMKWIGSELREGTDFGRIHVASRDKCSAGSRCTNPHHFSKPSLFKPGSEKICSMLGLTPTFPNSEQYEKRALAGETIETIVLRCQLVSASGNVVSEGMGARVVDMRDGSNALNKALKMAEKSAQIDATIRLGLSDTYTQDLEDMAAPVEDPAEPGPRTGTQESAQPKNKPIEYVDSMSCEVCQGPVIRAFSVRKKQRYVTCEMAQGVYNKDPDALLQMATFEKEHPDLAGRRHTWDWEKKSA
jgi:hypothetical protein